MDVFDRVVELQTLAPPPPALSLALFARPLLLLDGPLDVKFAAAAAASGSNVELWRFPLEPTLGFVALAGLRAMGLAIVRIDCAGCGAVVTVLVTSVKKVQVGGVLDEADGRQDGEGVGEGLQVTACTRFWCN